MPKKPTSARNNVLFDKWSIAHLCSGIALGWITTPAIAIILLVLWEPIEIFVLSPVLARAGITFGFEALWNSLSDIVFDITGVLIGALLLGTLVSPPFYIFQ